MRYSTDDLIMTLFLREVLAPTKISDAEELITFMKNVNDFAAELPTNTLSTSDLNIKAETILFTSPLVKSMLEKCYQYLIQMNVADKVGELFFDHSYTSLRDERLYQVSPSRLLDLHAFMYTLKVHAHGCYLGYHTHLMDSDVVHPPGEILNYIKEDHGLDEVGLQRLKNRLLELQCHTMACEHPIAAIIFQKKVAVAGGIIQHLDVSEEEKEYETKMSLKKAIGAMDEITEALQ